MAAMAVSVKRLDVQIGDLVEIDGRRYAEVPRVVRVGNRRRRRRPDLAEERPQPGSQRDEVVRRERQDRVLDRVVGQRGGAGSVAGELLRALGGQRHADPALLVAKHKATLMSLLAYT